MAFLHQAADRTSRASAFRFGYRLHAAVKFCGPTTCPIYCSWRATLLLRSEVVSETRSGDGRTSLCRAAFPNGCWTAITGMMCYLVYRNFVPWQSYHDHGRPNHQPHKGGQNGCRQRRVWHLWCHRHFSLTFAWSGTFGQELIHLRSHEDRHLHHRCFGAGIGGLRTGVSVVGNQSIPCPRVSN